MSEAMKVSDGRTDLPVFIHSEIDDSGLDVYERAVYLTMARRAGRRSTFFESIPNMAARLGVGTTKAREVLRSLEAYGLITRTERSGEPSDYTLTARSCGWNLPPAREKPTPTPRVAPTQHVGVPQRQALPTPTPGVAKGTPLKVLPLKVLPTPSPLPPMPAPSEVEVEVDQELSKATNAANRRQARNYATAILAQQHPDALAGLQDLQSVYSWRPGQYGVIADQILTLARDHGGTRVATAIAATLGSGAEIRQPLTYVRRILEGTPAAAPGAAPPALRSLDDVIGGMP